MKKQKQKYESPRILTYSSDDILKELGPAQACSPYWGSSAPQDNVPGYAPGLPPGFNNSPERRKRDNLFEK